jgi:hypothetical protein
MATYQDLTPVHRGDTIPLKVVNIKDVDGNNIDITSDEIWFTMKACLSDPDPGALQYNETVPSGADATAGTHAFEVPSTLTILVAPGTYFYDIQWVDPTPTPKRVHTIFYGLVEILADISLTV